MATPTKQHRYLDIADSLRNQIHNGEFEVGDRLPSLVEMYREHGATISTMQKVYDLLEKEELIERRLRSGVYVAATSRKRTKRGLVALVLPYLFDSGPDVTQGYMESSYIMRILRGIHKGAAEAGAQITMGTPRQLLDSPYPIDGLLLQGDNYLIREVARLNKPMVSFIVHPPELPSVGIDDRENGKAITGYLGKQGHRRIAALMGSDYDHISPLRLQGYQEALQEMGVMPLGEWHRQLESLSNGMSYVEAAYEAMTRWFREDWASLNCTAIVAQNDAVAVGVIRALRDKGYRVPEDVSVTGFDNAGDDWHFDLKLTTVEIPLQEIGQQAVAMLDKAIDKPDSTATHVKLPAKVIAGDSTMNI